MCFLCGRKWVLISQKTAFFIVTAMKTSNLTFHSEPDQNPGLKCDKEN
jgi:hypothetical protein